MSMVSRLIQPAAHAAAVYLLWSRTRNGVHPDSAINDTCDRDWRFAMKRIATSLTLAVMALVVPAALCGCDRELAHEKTVDVKDDGTVKTKEKTVTENAGGGVTVTEEKKTE